MRCDGVKIYLSSMKKDCLGYIIALSTVFRADSMAMPLKNHILPGNRERYIRLSLILDQTYKLWFAALIINNSIIYQNGSYSCGSPSSSIGAPCGSSPHIWCRHAFISLPGKDQRWTWPISRKHTERTLRGLRDLSLCFLPRTDSNKSGRNLIEPHPSASTNSVSLLFRIRAAWCLWRIVTDVLRYPNKYEFVRK